MTRGLDHDRLSRIEDSIEGIREQLRGEFEMRAEEEGADRRNEVAKAVAELRRSIIPRGVERLTSTRRRRQTHSFDSSIHLGGSTPGSEHYVLYINMLSIDMKYHDFLGIKLVDSLERQAVTGCQVVSTLRAACRGTRSAAPWLRVAPLRRCRLCAASIRDSTYRRQNKNPASEVGAMGRAKA
jgi:hypothetical protein